jgi:hypothetical protein
MSALPPKADIGTGLRSGLASDLRLAIIELERLEQYRLRVSRGDRVPRSA